MTFDRILVGLDRSELSQTVFAQSLALAQAFQAQLHLCCVLVLEPLGDVGGSPMALMPGLDSYSSFTDQTLWHEQTQAQINQTETWLNTYCQTAINQGVSTEFSHHIGDPGHMLCELAQSWQADVIVVGRRGRSGLAEVLLGSISNHVVHHASCSVLVVQTPHSPSQDQASQKHDGLSKPVDDGEAQ